MIDGFEICGGNHKRSSENRTHYECDTCSNRIIVPTMQLIPICSMSKKDIRNKRIDELLKSE